MDNVIKNPTQEELDQLLRFAIENNSLFFIDKAIEMDANINCYIGYPYLQPMLFYAIERYKDINIIEHLVKKGANVNLANPYQQTPLMHAVLTINLEVIKILLTADIDLTLKDFNGETALDMALRYQKAHPSAYVGYSNQELVEPSEWNKHYKLIKDEIVELLQEAENKQKGKI